MALKSPVQFHNFWGVFPASGNLPNILGNPYPPSLVDAFNLEAGDFAYVPSGPSAGTFWLCTFAGTSQGADAVWVPLSTGGGGGTDRFAPKYLVGNVPAGDSNVPYSSDGFTYFPDLLGNGAAIEAALTAAGGFCGDVWIRPGTYNLGLPGSPGTMPLQIPSGVRVYGSGYGGGEDGLVGTQIIGKAGVGEDQSVFDMQFASQLHQLIIQSPQSLGTIIGKQYVVGVRSFNTTIANVAIFTAMDQSPSAVQRHALYIDPGPGAPAVAPVSLDNVLLINDFKEDTAVPVDSSNLKMVNGSVSARNLSVRGCAKGIEVANGLIASGPSGDRVCEFRGDDVFVEAQTLIGIHYYEAVSGPNLPFGKGSIRLNRARVSGMLSENAIGVLLDSGNGHALSECKIDLSDTTGSKGVLVIADTGTATSTNVTISACEISARSIGVGFTTNTEGILENAVLANSQVSVRQVTPSVAGDRYAVFIGAQGQGQGTVRNILVDSNTIYVDGDEVPT